MRHRFRLKQPLLYTALACLLYAFPAAAQKEGRGLKLDAPNNLRELPAKTKRYALVIGVDKYADTQISTLGGSSNDARLLADSLVTYAGFPRDQVVLLASDQPVERQPTRGNVLRRLSNLATIVPRDGLLLFAFAGHGMERSGQAFLLPSDAQLSDDVNLLEQTAVNVMHIKQWVQKTGVRQVLMILDACRNDPAGRANADNPLTANYTRGFNFDVRNREVSAFATLYATAVGRRAYEFKEKRHGYFTWALVEGLRGAAANERGEVTLGGLVNYLQNRVPKQVLLDLGRGKEQRPFAVVEGYKADDLVLAVTKPGSLPVNTGITAAGDESRGVGNVNDMSNESAEPALAGTTWTGMNESGEYIIEFLAEGKLRYTLLSNKRPVGGTWKMTGNFIQIMIGNYSALSGTLENNLMKLEGTNLEGEKFNRTLVPKTP